MLFCEQLLYCYCYIVKSMGCVVRMQTLITYTEYFTVPTRDVLLRVSHVREQHYYVQLRYYILNV